MKPKPFIEYLGDLIPAQHAGSKLHRRKRNTNDAEQCQPTPIQDLRAQNQHQNAAAKYQGKRKRELLDRKNKQSSAARSTNDSPDLARVRAGNNDQILGRLNEY